MMMMTMTMMMLVVVVVMIMLMLLILLSSLVSLVMTMMPLQIITEDISHCNMEVQEALVYTFALCVSLQFEINRPIKLALLNWEAFQVILTMIDRCGSDNGSNCEKCD